MRELVTYVVVGTSVNAGYVDDLTMKMSLDLLEKEIDVPDPAEGAVAVTQQV